jgi:hypothetical protein
MRDGGKSKMLNVKGEKQVTVRFVTTKSRRHKVQLDVSVS